MGQKLNPTIFRLGVNKIWKTEFIEKKNRELPLYIFKDLEIKNYIERIFETNGMIVHDYKQHYNASTLNLYISYFITSDFVLDNSKSREKLIVKNGNGNRCVIYKEIRKNISFYEFSSNKIIKNLLLNPSKFYEMKKYFKVNSHSQLLTQSFAANFLETQNNKSIKVSSNQTKINIESFCAGIFAVLNSFFGTHVDIVLNFCCINKNVHFYKFTQEKTFIAFQKFKNTPFFKDGIELLFNVAYNLDSANLLAKFIAFQLKKVKRHKFFLSFLKQTLSVLIASRLAKIKGIKIIVKGRLNGVPRAKYKILIIGDVPVQTISAKLDYSQITTHNSNGSYGIKVWVAEK
ncbi:30S ribosomal protein S3 (mitochondrion) [Nitzschia inconspicua]|uniref:30S ribosomal protein S3 n=1 Tax=Nitzschia inconspicua TaxID=303405 RepID=A0A8H2SII7_9STRA|nr:30S ribosomal protein S3 [Nitzschia inconspicua]